MAPDDGPKNQGQVQILGHGSHGLPIAVAQLTLPTGVQQSAQTKLQGQTVRDVYDPTTGEGTNTWQTSDAEPLVWSWPL